MALLVHFLPFQNLNECSTLGSISCTRTHVPMFVLKLGFIKSGQTYACPQLGAFCMKILYTFAYFAFLGYRLSALSISAVFYRTFGCRSIPVGFFI